MNTEPTECLQNECPHTVDNLIKDLQKEECPNYKSKRVPRKTKKMAHKIYPLIGFTGHGLSLIDRKNIKTQKPIKCIKFGRKEFSKAKEAILTIREVSQTNWRRITDTDIEWDMMGKPTAWEYNKKEDEHEIMRLKKEYGI